jgi:DNA-binding GntR family transcriptional regulator
MTIELPKKISRSSAPGKKAESVPILTQRPAGLNDAEVDVFRKLLVAISDRRLTPGVKLTEEELAAIFEVSRERIRRVLLVLSQQGIVTLEPNRGASVARLSVSQRRDAFEARRILELHVVQVLAKLDAKRRKEIQAALVMHVNEEQEAIGLKNRTSQIRLSGEFHLKLAAFAGNSQVLRVLQELQALTSLALAAHPHVHNVDCSIAEHKQLVDAIAQGDVNGAASALSHHLRHLEEDMQERNENGSVLQRALSSTE